MKYNFNDDPFEINTILLEHPAYNKGYNDALRDAIENATAMHPSQIISMLEGMFKDA